MNPGEYEVLARAEKSHWWYLGLRDAIARSLEGRRLGPHPRVLDAGCGTGANLAFLRDLLQPAYLGGFDSTPEALELARAAVPEADLYTGDIRHPEIHQTPLDLVVSFDVIYIPGAPASMRGLELLVEQLRPGGLMLWNLPAYRWLYSEHDAALHTAERFTRTEVGRLLERLGLEVELLTYRLCLLFPVIVLARLPGLLRGVPSRSAARSDLHRIPGPRLNRFLLRLLELENRWIARGGRLPWGSSVFALARRP